MDDADIIKEIIEIIKTDGEEMSDGECLDAIVRVIESKYEIEWGFR